MVSLQPAIRIAREGFPVYTKFYKMLKRSEKYVRRWPAATAAFLPDGNLPEMGQIIKLPDPGERYFSRKVQIKRLTRNSPIAAIL